MTLCHTRFDFRSALDPSATGLVHEVERSFILEEQCNKFGPGPEPTLAKVTPKTYAVLREELPASEGGGTTLEGLMVLT